MKQMLMQAKAAKIEITRLTTEQKNAALLAMADALIAREADILAANALDLDAARGTVSDVMLDRLQLTSARIEGMAEGIRQVAALPDPVGHLLEEYTRADGLQLQSHQSQIFQDTHELKPMNVHALQELHNPKPAPSMSADMPHDGIQDVYANNHCA